MEMNDSYIRTKWVGIRIHATLYLYVHTETVLRKINVCSNFIGLEKCIIPATLSIYHFCEQRGVFRVNLIASNLQDSKSSPGTI